MAAERAMTGWADAALRLRDTTALGVMAVAGPVCAILAVALVLMRRTMGQPPMVEHLAVAFLCIVIGVLMVLARWRLSRGRPATVTLGLLAVIHGLAGAIFLRAALGEAVVSVFPAYAAGYLIAMALLLAWCTRVPIRQGGGEGG